MPNAKPGWFILLLFGFIDLLVRMDEFQKITGMTHTEQGIWWLNGFWKEKCGQEYAETLWKVMNISINYHERIF